MRRRARVFPSRRCALPTKIRSADATASRISTTVSVARREQAPRIPENASAKRRRVEAKRSVRPVRCAPCSRASTRTIARASSAAGVGSSPSSVLHRDLIAGSSVLRSLLPVRSLRLRRRAPIRATRSARAPRTRARSAANDHARDRCARAVHASVMSVANDVRRDLAVEAHPEGPSPNGVTHRAARPSANAIAIADGVSTAWTSSSAASRLWPRPRF